MFLSTTAFEANQLFISCSCKGSLEQSVLAQQPANRGLLSTTINIMFKRETLMFVIISVGWWWQLGQNHFEYTVIKFNDSSF